MLYQVKYFIKDMNYKDIARKLGVNEYVIQKLLPFTSKYSNDEIIDKLYRVCLMDEKIKCFGYDRNEVLKNFIISI